MTEPNTHRLCPCGSQQAYADCCKPYLTEVIPAPTPETLMRSRYTAYTQANTDYLAQTMQGAVAQDFNPYSTRLWAQSVEWLGLSILDAPAVKPTACQGIVEFFVRFNENSKTVLLHERSKFEKIGDTWLYVGFLPVSKIQRNDPCPCGSHKKFKKCCGNLS